MYPNPLLAFLLSIIPGLGHLYANRKIRGLLYGAGCLGAFVLFLFMMQAREREPAVFFFFISAVIWLVNMIDMVVYLLSPKPYRHPQHPGYPTHPGYAGYPGHPGHPGHPGDGQFRHGHPGAGSEQTRRQSGAEAPELSGGEPIGRPGDAAWGEPLSQGSGGYSYGVYPSPPSNPNERFYTILLSFFPGLGHFHLGLMQRGLAFLLTFFGLFAMVVFVSFTIQDDFIVFLLALPVIWFYSLFDAVQMLNRKQRGESLADRSIFDELETHWGEGKKSRMMATLLAVFPGASHMYLGLQRRGLQLMAAFLLSIYILDTMRLSLFLFLIPLVWFFSLFDALQHISKYGREPLQDTPVVGWLMNNPKWVGFGLLALGAYYLFDDLALPLIEQYLPELRPSFWFHRYFKTVFVSFILILGGLRLLLGSKTSKGGDEQ